MDMVAGLPKNEDKTIKENSGSFYRARVLRRPYPVRYGFRPIFSG
jgi:hypothetical protein